MIESATRDGEIPAIFNPKRVRTPSVVVTGDSPNGPSPFGFVSIPPITHSDSVTSSQPGDGAESLTGIIIGDLSLTQHNQQSNSTSTERLKAKGCKGSCCSELAQKMYFGVCVTILITFSWVGATHCFKFLYLNSRRNSFLSHLPSKNHNSPLTQHKVLNIAHHSYSAYFTNDNNMTQKPLLIQTHADIAPPAFNAPFFASWCISSMSILFFPLYLLFRGAAKKCGADTETLGDILRGLRDRGFTIGRFINRCISFCILWLVTNYLYALALRALLSTDVIALFATNVASVYLLSWVILHEQFVGVRIVAVIMCDTGIALLAHCGSSGSSTLTGVVLAALSAAGYAVFRVMFRKIMRDPPVGQVALIFTVIGFLNAALLWPICIILYFLGVETLQWETVTGTILLIASVLFFLFNLLTQFSGAVTYTMFVTLGLITSVPVSAALDIILYGANFQGMELGGIILISVGFFLVMFPNNWPDYITKLLRKLGICFLTYQCCCDYGEITEYENSKYHIVGQQELQMETSIQKRKKLLPRNHRLQNRLYSVELAVSVRPGEMRSPNLQASVPTHSSSSYVFSSNRNSVAETNFFAVNDKRHRFSYTSE